MLSGRTISLNDATSSVGNPQPNPLAFPRFRASDRFSLIDMEGAVPLNGF
ncbi:MAG: hypothetical protein BWY72_02494 [Bacteroidetes bacterium ADurb.Bin416]|nr:MAG: hypothetical protein BWY72_02494 [Bacteroidetes bacterium ADurb.Bin416]